MHDACLQGVVYLLKIHAVAGYGVKGTGTDGTGTHSSVVVLDLEIMVFVSSGLEAKSAGLGLAFKQDQNLINFYCAISDTKL